MGNIMHGIAKSGYTNNNVRGRLVTSGAHTSSTSATDLTDGAAGAGSVIAARKGDILTIRNDEAGRVMFGGVAATATLGHPVPANETTHLEISADGAISVIDVA